MDFSYQLSNGRNCVKWKVNNDGSRKRRVNLIIVLLFLLITSLAEAGFDPDLFHSAGFLVSITLVVFVGILFPIYSALNRRIKKWVPTEVEVIPEEKRLVLRSDSAMKEISFSQLGYSYCLPEKGTVPVLELKKEVLGTRGQVVIIKVTTLVGFKRGKSWTKGHLEEIIQCLIEAGVKRMPCISMD